ncbi:MAG: S1 RNA-binding domain-containing protein, partial [Pseudomonadota bacterium]
DGVEEISDLKPGMKLEGTVTNVTNFGAFVDVGVHQDGLVHVSQLADRFVDDPHQVVKAGDIVKVTILDVDVPRKRISMTMKSQADYQGQRDRSDRDRSAPGNRDQGNRNQDNRNQGQRGPGGRGPGGGGPRGGGGGKGGAPKGSSDGGNNAMAAALAAAMNKKRK